MQESPEKTQVTRIMCCLNTIIQEMLDTSAAQDLDNFHMANALGHLTRYFDLHKQQVAGHNLRHLDPSKHIYSDVHYMYRGVGVQGGWGVIRLESTDSREEVP
jgi:hypothetical protein